MKDIFLNMLREGLPACVVDGDYELLHIHKFGVGMPPVFEEAQVMAEDDLGGLEYRLTVKSCAGEMSSIGDLFLEMCDQSHFMVLSQGEDLYAAVINLGWRGKPLVDPLRREKYLDFLTDYFRTSDI
ncbi:MAG: hypothetical protein AABX47_01625 [Nanoarchaeota archaeon]